MKAGVYVRVSTDRQATEGESLDMQIARARELCAANGWEMVEPYIDVLSGRKDQRPALKRFEDDLRAGKFQAVICYKVDRLGRSRRKLHDILEHIQQEGIRLVSMTQQIDTSTATGRMMLSILVDFAVFEVEQLGERVSDTMLHIAKTGRPVGGAAPYGYRYERKRVEVGPDGSEVTVPPRLVIVPEEAEAVRLAFDTYLRAGLYAAARALNDAGYRTQAGKAWDQFKIERMILNPTYGGQRAVRRQPYVGGKRKGWRYAKETIGEWIIVEGNHEAIVPREAAEKARERHVASRREVPRRRTAKNHWSGLLVCTGCGRRLVGHKTDRGLKFHCPNRLVFACDTTSVSATWIELDVLAAITEAIDGSSLIQRSGGSVKRKASKATPAVPSTERQIAALQGKLSKIEFRYEHDVIDGPTYLAERKKVLDEIAALQAAKETVKPAPAFVLPQSFAETWARLSSDDAIEDRRSLLGLVLDKIAIDNAEAVVIFKPFASVEGLPGSVAVPRWQDRKPDKLRGKWSLEAAACVECGTSERPHFSQGKCRRCWKREYQRAYRERNRT